MSLEQMRSQSEAEHRPLQSEEADAIEISVLCLLLVVSVIGMGMLAALVA